MVYLIEKPWKHKELQIKAHRCRFLTSVIGLEKIGQDTVAPGDRIQPNSAGLGLVAVAEAERLEQMIVFQCMLAYHTAATRFNPA
jgi:hypothetical protein